MTQKHSLSLAFTGDIGFDKYMYKKWEDEELISEDIKAFLDSADHVVVNVEGPLSKMDMDASDDKASTLIHSMDPQVGCFLKELGADVWNICNNHIMDAGTSGIADTLKIAHECDAFTLGAGMDIEEAKQPVVFEEAGGVGLIGVGYQRACRKASDDSAGCLSWSDMDTIKALIAQVKSTCRWCIIVAHGGEEFTALPSPYTRKRYVDYLDMGADIVVGHHPHVPMNYEKVGEKVIFYSLGNFIFDTDYQRCQYNTDRGVIVKLLFDEDTFNIESLGIRIDRETEHIVKEELPAIFTEVDSDEYEKLAPLSAKMFIENTKKQWRYLKPEKFLDATEKDWLDDFYEPKRSGRVPGEVLDFQIVVPLAYKADEGLWKESKLEGVKEYILSQMR